MSDECSGCAKCRDDWCTGCDKRRDDVVDHLCPSCREFYYPESESMRHARELAIATAALLDQLARGVPEVAAECIATADRLRAWAGEVKL